MYVYIDALIIVCVDTFSVILRSVFSKRRQICFDKKEPNHKLLDERLEGEANKNVPAIISHTLLEAVVMGSLFLTLDVLD